MILQQAIASSSAVWLVPLIGSGAIQLLAVVWGAATVKGKVDNFSDTLNEVKEMVGNIKKDTEKNTTNIALLGQSTNTKLIS